MENYDIREDLLSKKAKIHKSEEQIIEQTTPLETKDIDEVVKEINEEINRFGGITIDELDIID